MTIEFNVDSSSGGLENTLQNVVAAYKAATKVSIMSINYDADDETFDVTLRKAPLNALCSKCQQPMKGSFQVSVAGDMGPTPAYACVRMGCGARGVLVVRL